ncbi:MAG TPA: hypothetical protein PKN76_06030 [bacterium]|nr:hypothetical protein [bacterium]HOB71027.1 hypothetical protein [bacterium]HOG43966.1 hypothetical protein [bacterium]
MISRFLKSAVFIAVLFFCSSLTALIEGRIAGNRISSLSAEISLEKSEFLYNAPLLQYFNLNFGFMVNRFQNPGLSFGVDFQWLDAEHAAGTMRFNGIFLTNRTFSDIILGGYVDASLVAGAKISGFKGVVHSIVTATPGSDPLVGLEFQLGAYVSPHESVNFFLAPAFGKYFVKSDSFYFNFILSLEVFLWK